MNYQMHIISDETVEVVNNETGINVKIVVGHRYIFKTSKPTTRKSRKNNNRIVEILGFSDNFMGDAIVRYVDTNRRGRLSPCYLLPYN